jgi:hypothetical protein
MDDEEVRLKIRKRVEEFHRHFHNSPSIIYLVVSGILQKQTGSLSKMKVDYILEQLRFTYSEILKVKGYLTDKGWFVPNRRNLLELSDPAWDLFEEYKQSLTKEDWEEEVNFVLAKAEDFKSDTSTSHPYGPINSLTKKVGEDLVIYADKGERKRVKYGLLAIKRIKKGYRKVYILHAPKNDNFLKEVKREATEFSTLPVETMESEIWRKENFKKILDIANQKRNHLDVLITAMPRACIVQLYRNLNFPQIACTQNWYYNKAEKYVYDKEGYVTNVEVLERGSKKGIMMCFGENVVIRFEDELFYDLVNESASTLIGRADYNIYDLSYTSGEIGIDKRTQKMVDKSLKENIQLVGQIKSFNVDYNTVWSIYHYLRSISPDTIWLSGNRITALAIAIYWVECLKTGRDISIFAPHVEADSYSEGIIPELKSVHTVLSDELGNGRRVARGGYKFDKTCFIPKKATSY